MTRSTAPSKRSIQGRPKVKTGCGTCRVRKIKCDENKPFCQKCVSTGRTCEGYQSRFRLVTSQPVNNTHAGAIKSGVDLQLTKSPSTEISSQAIDLLNRYFSTKTIFDVNLGCDEEAKQVLQAGLANTHIQHAVLSLIALREDLEASGYRQGSITQSPPGHSYGLRHYCMALGGLASNLSSPGFNGLKSTLLCCQIFISIEQVQGNYAAMAEHIIRGLSIMREYRARPDYVAGGKLVRASHGSIPFLDVFVIKLFAAPCKFAEPSPTAEVSETTTSGDPTSPHQSTESLQHRMIAPDMRTELARIAISTIEFLDRVSQVKSTGNALRLVSEKTALLESLESWKTEIEFLRTNNGHSGPETISVSFLRFFHSILKVILLGTLDSSPGFCLMLQTEINRLQSIANNVGERVRSYSLWIETSRS